MRPLSDEGVRSRPREPHTPFLTVDCCCSELLCPRKAAEGRIYRSPRPTSQGFLIVFLHQDFVLGY